MKQRIEIRNFGPIKEVDLDISDYTLFIGPNASGKSTIVKIVHFFMTPKIQVNSNFIKHLVEHGTLDINMCDWYVSIQRQFNEIWDIQALQDDFQIRYYQDFDGQSLCHAITLKKENKELNVSFTDSFLLHIHDTFLGIATSPFYLTEYMAMGITPETQGVKPPLFPLFIIDELSSNHHIAYSLFIPAGRQILALPNDSFPLFSEGRIDPFIEEFMKLVKRKKSSFNKFIQEEFNRIEQRELEETPENSRVSDIQPVKLAIDLSAKILKGDYINTREGERIYFDEKQFVKLYESSSGQQESLWILNLIYLVLWENCGQCTTNFTIIEEPEAHLYPETQRDVTNLFSLLANQPGNQVMITTHSPYILSALNNLLYAHQAGKTKPDEVAEVIDPLLWVDLDRVAAYVVEDGKIRDIIDRELGMINAEEIDSASRTIADEFDKILQLEV